jgi:hypothetical protein
MHAIPTIAKIQTVYYVITAAWPFVSQQSFESVTGPKTDKWLVKTVGLLIGVIGLTLAIPGSPKQRQFLGMSAASALTAIDLYYALKGRISKIYLTDSLIEIALLFGWLYESDSKIENRRNEQDDTEAQDGTNLHISN